MSEITLSKSVRSNLLSLQGTADLMAMTQERLATGKKVNSALDNPTNFFTASSLNSRANDLNALMDGMANGIQTLQAADNGIKAITKTLESMQSTMRQARQDKSFHTDSYVVAYDPAAPGVFPTPADVTFLGGQVNDGLAGSETAVNIDGMTLDEAIKTINSAAPVGLGGMVRASNDRGMLRIENLSTQPLTVDTTSSSITTSADPIPGNSVRAELSNQYNELRDQLDKLSDDASFNGINLLRGDKLKITFNESGTSEIEIQSKIDGVDGESLNTATLGLSTNMAPEDLDSDVDIDAFLMKLKDALGVVRTQASSFGSSLSIVQNRQDFSKNMINTLQTGASNLTLADMNEEAANLLALQTRQGLSQQSLSLASQADQSVLQLLR